MGYLQDADVGIYCTECYQIRIGQRGILKQLGNQSQRQAKCVDVLVVSETNSIRLVVTIFEAPAGNFGAARAFAGQARWLAQLVQAPHELRLKTYRKS